MLAPAYIGVAFYFIGGALGLTDMWGCGSSKESRLVVHIAVSKILPRAHMCIFSCDWLYNVYTTWIVNSMNIIFFSRALWPVLCFWLVVEQLSWLTFWRCQHCQRLTHLKRVAFLVLSLSTLSVLYWWELVMYVNVLSAHKYKQNQLIVFLRSYSSAFGLPQPRTTNARSLRREEKKSKICQEPRKKEHR